MAVGTFSPLGFFDDPDEIAAIALAREYGEDLQFYTGGAAIMRCGRIKRSPSAHAHLGRPRSSCGRTATGPRQAINDHNQRRVGRVTLPGLCCNAIRVPGAVG